MTKKSHRQYGNTKRHGKSGKRGRAEERKKIENKKIAAKSAKECEVQDPTDSTD